MAAYDHSTKTMQFDVPTSFRDSFRAMAKDEGLTMTKLFIEISKQYLWEHEQPLQMEQRTRPCEKKPRWISKLIKWAKS